METSKWDDLRTIFQETNWDTVFAVDDIDFIVVRLVAYILHWWRTCITQKRYSFTSSAHPWLNKKCSQLVKDTHAAEGTAGYAIARDKCTQGLLHEFNSYACRVKLEISGLSNSSKTWWKLCNNLMAGKSCASNVPPLQKVDKSWAFLPLDQAEAFAKTFLDKFHLPAPVATDSDVDEEPPAFETGFLMVRTRRVVKILASLDQHSATGPDGLPSMILKNCARELAYPVARLLRLMLAQGVWPRCWRLHWMLPLFKRKARSQATNYRGVHLTSRISKVAECVIGQLILPRLLHLGAYGPRQFAYCPGRSYKDALLLCVAAWTWALCVHGKIGLYCSDVAGAFDKVKSERLCTVLGRLGLHYNIFKLLCCWLEPHEACVIVNNR